MKYSNGERVSAKFKIGAIDKDDMLEIPKGGPSYLYIDDKLNHMVLPKANDSQMKST